MSFIRAKASSRRFPCSTPELTSGMGMSLMGRDRREKSVKKNGHLDTATFSVPKCHVALIDAAKNLWHLQPSPLGMSVSICLPILSVKKGIQNEYRLIKLLKVLNELALFTKLK